MIQSNLNDKTLLVVGLGLIGGSFAMACKNHQSVGRVIGYDRDADAIAGAIARGLVDRGESDLTAAVKEADIIFIAVPILATRSILSLIQPYLKPEAILTDAGSAKGIVVSDVRATLTPEQCVQFVPGHPIAGAERSGVMAATPNLYANHRIILTPMPETQADAVAVITALWESIGAQIDTMAIDHHDDVLAATSHLPHLLAFNLVDTLAKNTENSEIFHYAAGGFRDFTRIAASDPIMWHDIFMANRESVLLVMDQYLAELHLLRNAVAHADGDYMKSVFRNAKVARDHFSQILSDRQLKDE